MMISDKERRRVAEELRELRHTTYYREEIVENICDAISIADPANTFREPEDVYKLLADLIDPTCHLVETTSEDGLYGPEIFHHELSCGHTCDTAWAEPPAYCDECGARVVEKEEDE